MLPIGIAVGMENHSAIVYGLHGPPYTHTQKYIYIYIYVCIYIHAHTCCYMVEQCA